VCAQDAVAAVAAGRAIVQRTDPQASSPAGVIYQIPLDTGRRDAAPVLPVGSRPGSTSSAAPTGGESASSATPSGGGTPGDPSSIHSENGFGSSSAVPGVSRAALRIGAGVPAAHTAGSTFPSYLLMMLIGVAAIAVGLIASRGRGASK
jgi:hypothetical protein